MAGIKFGLGGGIEALLPIGIDEDVDRVAGRTGDVMLSLDKISANPGQPRKNFDEDALAELAESIKQHGVIQPVLVEAGPGDSYTIITGERRTRAARMAGLSEIPVIVREFSDEQRIAVALVENIQRADLNPIEEATAYKQLMEAANISQDQAAARVGKKRSTLANAMRLLKLPSAMQDALRTGAISAGHARALLSVDSEAERQRLFSRILDEALSVREAEKQAAQAGRQADSTEPQRQAPPKKPDPELAAITQKFIETLGSKVTIDGSTNKGCIRIEYFNEDDLKRIYDTIVREG
jgi:ParB family chromosome partitioning protein